MKLTNCKRNTQTVRMRLCLLLLALTLLLPLLIACADPDQKKPVNQPTAPTEATGESGVDYLLSLPKADYDEEINILVRDEEGSLTEFVEEDTTGELIGDAIYRRNARVEQYLNVKLKTVTAAGGWDGKDQFIARVRRSTSTGDHEFQLAGVYMAYASEMTMDGCFYDLNDIPTLKTDSPWWAKGFVDNNIVNDHLYMIVGDSSLSMWKNIYVTSFNKQMALDNGVNDLYDTVRNEEWTLEKLRTYTELVTVDSNGDDVYDQNDTYGLLWNRHVLRSLVTSFAIPVATRGEDGFYEMTYYNEHTTDVYSALYDFIFSGHSVYMNVKDDGDTTLTVPMFLENRALFFMATLNESTKLRNMENDFGIVPVPKYDDDQDEYRTHTYDGFSVLAVPVDIEDPNMIGAVMDAMSAESCYSVVPKYYDVLLKDRTSRDKDSAEMLDLVRKNLYYDFGYTHYTTLNYALSLFGDNLSNKVESFASLYEGSRSKFEQSLQDINDAYADLD